MTEFLGYDPDSESDKKILGYVPDYQRIAETLGPAARVCEIGVFNGYSLRMWQELFPRGLIAGVDINPGACWPDGTVKIIASQDDPALPGLLDVHAPDWDLIVDDASHNGTRTQATFDLLWPRVAPGGFYVIEDWFIGLPQWLATGCWKNSPPGTAGPASYDPGMLHVVQGLLTRLDEPFRGFNGSAGLSRDNDVESVTCRYGMAIVRKYAAAR
jgi:Methyltransferase domain